MKNIKSLLKGIIAESKNSDEYKNIELKNLEIAKEIKVLLPDNKKRLVDDLIDSLEIKDEFSDESILIEGVLLGMKIDKKPFSTVIKTALQGLFTTGQ